MSLMSSLCLRFLLPALFLSSFANDISTDLQQSLIDKQNAIIHSLFNHNFAKPFQVDDSITSLTDPSDPIAFNDILSKLEVIQIAQEHQLLMTETHGQTMLTISDASAQSWVAKTNIALSLVKGPVEIYYPMTNVNVFTLSDDGVIYLSDFALQPTGQPKIINHLKARKRNCS